MPSGLIARAHEPHITLHEIKAYSQPPDHASVWHYLSWVLLTVFMNVPQEIKRKHVWIYFFLLHFLKNPLPFHPIYSCLSTIFTFQHRGSWPLAVAAHTLKHTHWENKEVACQQTAVYFSTQHRAKALGNKKQKQDTSLFSSSASILLAFISLPVVYLFHCPPPTPDVFLSAYFLSDTSSAMTKLTKNMCDWKR